ncbi:MAG: C10 family peptidase [Bacteroidaceae bacterium]|nr:C10 family peptidase [Bacteroidaceae bacterium]
MKKKEKRFALTLFSLLPLLAAAQVAPLVKTTWHQRSPYNDLCPSGKLAGCVAIAMAQVMNYHQYPIHGIGKSSYYWTDSQTKKRTKLSANYADTYYRWDDMDGAPVSAAQLVYHCGVSVWMDYSDSFSGSNEFYAKSALVDYFGYSEDIKLEARNKYTDEEWAALLKDNLDKGWPIIYSSGGHTFVVDGYNSKGLFHTNQGFGYSSPDCTYTLESLGSKSSSTALVNIHPAPSSKTCPTVPTWVIYLNDGNSQQYPYIEADFLLPQENELLIGTGEEIYAEPLNNISYFKAISH